MVASTVQTTASPASDTSTSLRIGIVVLSAAVVVLAAAYLRVVPYGRAFWDFLFVLDGAYRIGTGQIPHVDFASPIGPLTLYLTHWAERAFPGGQPFVGLHALMWLALAPAVTALAPRFSSTLAFLGALVLLALMVLVPYTLDSTNLSEISYFAVYNRFASGLLFLVGLWYVLPKRRWDGLLLAYLLVLLFFLKITAAIAAMGLLLCGLALGRYSLRPILIGIAGAAAVSAIMQATSGMVTAYVADVARMATINEGHAIYALAFAAFRNWAPLAAAGALALLVLAQWVRMHPSSGRPAFALVGDFLQKEAFLIDALLLVGMALVAESQNTGGIGLVSASAFLFHPALNRQAPLQLVGAAILGTALLLPLLDIDVRRSITAISREHQGTEDHPIAELAPGLRIPNATLEGARIFQRVSHEWLTLAEDAQSHGFNFDNDPTSNAPAARLAWAEDVVDAAKTFKAKAYGSLASRYATLAFQDPFTRLLNLPPARHVSLVMGVGRTVPLFTREAASRYLADADGVFVSLCELTNGEETNDAAFKSVLDKEFERLSLNACWDFYHRKLAASPGPAEPHAADGQ